MEDKNRLLNESQFVEYYLILTLTGEKIQLEI